MLDGKVIAALHVSLAGRFLFRFLPLRKQVVMKNIQLAFNHLSEKEQTRFAKAFYSHLAKLIKEFFLIGWYQKKGEYQHVELRGVEHLLAAHQKDKGVILLVGHLGNWEFAPILGLPALKSLREQFWIVRRPIRNKWLENIFFQRLQNAGIKVVSSLRLIKMLPSILDKKGIILYAFDQHADVKTKHGIAVNFFGLKAGTYKSVAIFAHKKKAPIIPTAFYRLPNGKHVLEFFPELEWQHSENIKQSVYENTRIYNQAMETMILAHPEQWYWVHRRWKFSDHYQG